MEQKKRIDPAALDLERLTYMQGGLIANLILTTKELQKRYEGFAEAARALPNMNAETAEFDLYAKELRGFKLILETMFSKTLVKRDQVKL